MKFGILGRQDKGSTFECIRPGLWIMTIPGKVAKTKPHAVSLLFTFLYIFAQVSAEWSVTSIILSPSTKG